MARQKSLSITVGERFETGMIATTVDAHGERTSRHYTGSGLEAMRAVAEYCDAHDLKVAVVSTPASIFRDLGGNREVDADHAKGDRRSVALILPEAKALGRIGRMDLLA